MATGNKDGNDEGLVSWETAGRKPLRGTPSPEWQAAQTARKRVRRRRWLKILLWTGGALVVILAVAVALVPTIGGRLAPGIIEGAAKGKIAGRVKVSGVGLSWGGPTVVGPVELFDDHDKSVGTAEVTVPAGMWEVIAGCWWSRKDFDLGEVVVSGSLNVERAKDGTTNLQRAIATPRGAPSRGGGSGGGGGVESVKALVKIDSLDVTYTDRTAEAAGTPAAAGIGLRRLTGDADVAWSAAGAGGSTASVKSNLSASVKTGPSGGGGGGVGDKVKVAVDASIKQDSKGRLDQVKATAEVTGAPIDLVDGLAGFGGELARSIGPRADVKVTAAGNLDKAKAALTFRSDGAQADLALVYENGRLTTEKPGRLSLRSTGFLAGLPAAKQALARGGGAGQWVTLDGGAAGAPGLEAGIVAKGLPLPKEWLVWGGGGGAKQPAKFDLGSLDLRGAGMTLTLTTTEIKGAARLEALSAAKAGPPAPSAPAAPAGVPPSPSASKPFKVEPIGLTISAPDLAGPIHMKAGTKATAGEGEGQSAGQIDADITATKLLNAEGRADFTAAHLQGSVKVTGVSTALVQPIVAALVTSVPLDLTKDLGPTVDAEVLLAASEGLGAAGDTALDKIPPTEITLRLTSDNLKATGQARLAKGVLTTRADGLVATVATSTPLAQRIMAKPGGGGGESPVAIGGKGAVRLAVTGVEAPLVALSLDKIKATAEVVVDDVAVTVTGSADKAAKHQSGKAADKNGAAPVGPVEATHTIVRAVLEPGKDPSVTFDSALKHEGTPFAVKGQFAAAGLAGNASEGGGAAKPTRTVGQLLALGLTGRLDATGVPRSLTKLSPGLADSLNAGAGTDAAAESKRLVSALLGDKVDVNVTLTRADGGGQGVSAHLAGSGAAADVTARLRQAEVALLTATAQAHVTPAQVNGLLAAVDPAGVTPAPAPPAEKMRLHADATLRLALDPLTIPIEEKGGTITPQWAKAGTITAHFTVAEDVMVDSAPIRGAGAPRSTIGVKGLAITAAAPAASLLGTPAAGAPATPPSSKLTASLSGDVIGPDGRLGHLDGSVAMPADGKYNFADAQVEVKLADVNTAAAERLINQPGLLTGAMGDTAVITLRGHGEGDWETAVMGPAPGTPSPAPTAKGRLLVDVGIESPRVSGAAIKAAMDAESVRLTEPAKVTIKPDVAFVNRYVLGGNTAPPKAPAPRDGSAAPAPQAESVRLAEATPLTLDIAELAVSIPRSVKGEGGAEHALSGPLKPGVFKADLTVSSPKASLIVASGGAEGTPLNLEGIRAHISTRTAPAPPPAPAPAPAPPPKPAAPPPPPAAGAIYIDAAIAHVSGQGVSGSQSNTIRGTITGLADGAGILTPDKAALTLDADVDAFPTPIIDTLARQRGLMTEALGPTVSLKATARDLSRSGGSLEAQATALRATARVKGTIKDGAFVESEPTIISIIEIRPELVQHLGDGLPMVLTLEKKKEEKPGIVTGESLSVPVDGDLTKLNGTVRVDLGMARFQTKSALSDLLKLTHGHESGDVGQHLEPFVVHMDRGVLHYDRFRLPLGEFSLETRGTVDLVSRQIDVVTYVPFFALTDQAAGVFNTGVAGRVPGLDKATLVPITTKGSLDSPKTKIDVELFFKEFGGNLLKTPGKGLEDLLKGVLDKKKPDGGK